MEALRVLNSGGSLTEAKTTTPMEAPMCASCEVLSINGVLCHETGCPEAWKSYTRECTWCGQEFTPEEKHQDCCSDDCSEAYHG